MSHDDGDKTVLATLRPSVPRAAVGIVSLVLLAAFVLWTAVTAPPANPAWAAVLVAVGGLSLWAAIAMFRAAREELVLTRSALCTTSGRVLFNVADIRSVDRGALAFKPSGGFVVWLENRQGAGWAPGVWWRYGRMVGVGGMTRSAEAKAMAEILALLLAERVR